MKLKHMLFAMTACGLVMAPVTRAQADNLGAFAVGAVALCIASGTCTGKKRSSGATTSSSSSYQRQQNREVQSALNYFNYPVGTVDGALGPRSRAAISNYQADMGFPVSGYLDDFQRTFLVTAHQRAQAGAIAPYGQEFAAGGPRGFLIALRREQTVGGAPAPMPMNPSDPFSDPATTVSTQSPNALPTPQPQAPAAQAPVAAAEAPARSIPLFGSAPAASASMTQHCTAVNTRSLGNGGVMTVANISDPDLAMGEQFCMVRNDAIAQSDAIIATLGGVSFEQVEAQCAAFAGQLTPQLAALATKSVGEASTEAANFVAGSGLPADQVMTTGKICMGVGYKTDKPDVALASAYLMIGAGQGVYGEVVGHHLREGFGTVANPATAANWMSSALHALDEGATPAFRPAESANRAAVIRAAMMMNGQQANAAPVPQPAANTTALPTFVAQPAQ